MYRTTFSVNITYYSLINDAYEAGKYKDALTLCNEAEPVTKQYGDSEDQKSVENLRSKISYFRYLLLHVLS